MDAPAVATAGPPLLRPPVHSTRLGPPQPAVRRDSSLFPDHRKAHVPTVFLHAADEGSGVRFPLLPRVVCGIPFAVVHLKKIDEDVLLHAWSTAESLVPTDVRDDEAQRQEAQKNEAALEKKFPGLVHEVRSGTAPLLQSLYVPDPTPFPVALTEAVLSAKAAAFFRSLPDPQQAWDHIFSHAFLTFCCARARVWRLNPAAEQYDERFPPFLFLTIASRDMRRQKSAETRVLLTKLVPADSYDSAPLSSVEQVFASLAKQTRFQTFFEQVVMHVLKRMQLPVPLKRILELTDAVRKELLDGSDGGSDAPLVTWREKHGQGVLNKMARGFVLSYAHKEYMPNELMRMGFRELLPINYPLALGCEMTNRQMAPSAVKFATAKFKMDLDNTVPVFWCHPVIRPDYLHANRYPRVAVPLRFMLHLPVPPVVGAGLPAVFSCGRFVDELHPRNVRPESWERMATVDGKVWSSTPLLRRAQHLVQPGVGGDDEGFVVATWTPWERVLAAGLEQWQTNGRPYRVLRAVQLLSGQESDGYATCRARGIDEEAVLADALREDITRHNVFKTLCTHLPAFAHALSEARLQWDGITFPPPACPLLGTPCSIDAGLLRMFDRSVLFGLWEARLQQFAPLLDVVLSFVWDGVFPRHATTFAATPEQPLLPPPGALPPGPGPAAAAADASQARLCLPAPAPASPPVFAVETAVVAATQREEATPPPPSSPVAAPSAPAPASASAPASAAAAPRSAPASPARAGGAPASRRRAASAALSPARAPSSSTKRRRTLQPRALPPLLEEGAGAAAVAAVGQGGGGEAAVDEQLRRMVHTLVEFARDQLAAPASEALPDPLRARLAWVREHLGAALQATSEVERRVRYSVLRHNVLTDAMRGSIEHILLRHSPTAEAASEQMDALDDLVEAAQDQRGVLRSPAPQQLRPPSSQELALGELVLPPSLGLSSLLDSPFQ